MSFVAFAKRTIPLASYPEVKFNPAGPYLPGMLISFTVGPELYYFKVTAKTKAPQYASGKYWLSTRPDDVYTTTMFRIADYKNIKLVNRDK